MTADLYRTDDFPHGLRCADCHDLFVEGQPISERLDGIDEYAGDPLFCVTLICGECALRPAATS